MARAGAKVALLDKEHFPRDKICGDAVCTPGIRILEEMDLVQEFVAADEVHFADSGGFVSPAGLAYIGNSQHKLGGAAAAAIKRVHLDARLAAAAKRAGADLRVGFEVGKDVAFDAATGLWTGRAADGATVRARVLVCADGATSRLATQLGLCSAPPLGVSSRAFVEGGSHNADFDGVCFYPKWSLPGYAAIFKHAKDELGFCYYLIPSGRDAATGQCGRVHADELRRLHEDAIRHDPFISRAMGPAPKLERMRAGSLRVGGQGVARTYGDNLVIVGDAAGHIDPLTGEGIHTAMMGGKLAAAALLEARAAGDFSAANTARYEAAWRARYGHDFALSQAFANAIARFPILMDAVANEVQRKGDAMMSVWAEVATNMRPKSYFFRPDVALPLGAALVRELWAQKVVGRPSRYEMPALEGRANGAAAANGKK